MKKITRIVIAALITIIVAAIGFYIVLPPLNIYSQELYISLIFVMIVFSISYLAVGAKAVGGVRSAFAGKKFLKVLAISAAVPVLVLIIGNILSSTFVNAQKYSNIITVKEAVFEEDMPEADLVTNIALMDTDSATKIGDRTLGALSDVVSQYQVGGNYTQINYKRTPQKVANLEYVDFFKWIGNRDKGIPGFVMVDPVNSSAEYVKLNAPMKYVDSAYFNEDLMRKLRFSYPTKIFGNISFEVDDEGNPYYIVACMRPKISLFGAMDVNEAIVFNPCDGSSSLYALADIPAWVDNVFTGTLASQKYDWYGTLKNGFWNSVIGNKDCKVTTDDFGYIVLEDDVWFFTGVTSVSSDESNIGFIISNARTGEYKFYPVIGAEEYSAMQAAQGEVQEKGYVASFPSLINASGEATYIMVLKDNGGLVKLYALVNVENYSIVATGATQTEAKQKYIELLRAEGIVSDSESEQAPPADILEANIEVQDIRIITVGGESVMYITAQDKTLYKNTVASDESLMLLTVGAKIKVKYLDTANEKIKQMVSFDYFSFEKQE